MALEIFKESWPNKVNTLTIGGSKENGGTRSSTVTVGGESTLPYLFYEGEVPNKSVVAMEVMDIEPEDWPDALKAPFGDVLKDPGKWAPGKLRASISTVQREWFDDALELATDSGWVALRTEDTEGGTRERLFPGKSKPS